MSSFGLKDYFRESRLFQSRVSVAGVAVIALALLLLARLFYIQVFAHKYYATLSQENSINPVPIQPPRGLILDRNGVVLAQNFPVFTLEVVPDEVDNMDELLEQLGKLVTLNPRDLKNFRRQLRERPPSESLVLRTRLSEEEAARIATHRMQFSGVELKARLQRYYPLGGLAVDALGYVGRISEHDQARLDKARYRGMQYIGKLGIEQTYEPLLLGKIGFDEVENDAHGRAVRVVDRIAPHAGANLYLNIDAKMQAIAEQGLGTQKGAVVAMDPRTGAVLTFVSTPMYDPNLFVDGIDFGTYARLRDDPSKPLLNRALNGLYAPGSTIKPFYALAALESGELDPNKKVLDPGYYTLPGDTHRFHCWKRTGHGEVNLHDAIMESCDVYFYKLAVSIGIDRFKAFLVHLGFGQKTGIDLDGESAGQYPSPADYKARKLPWYAGQTVVMGIGQGPILVTPLQLADAVSVIANHGMLVRPRLLRGVENPVTKAVAYPPPAPAAAVPVRDPKDYDIVTQDMTAVVDSIHGTAHSIHNSLYEIAGKTGTAQVRGMGPHDHYNERTTPEQFRDHALFIAFAPANDPKIAIAIVVENAGHGGSAAAPIAHRLMDYYLLGEDKTKPVVLPTATTGH